MDIDEIIGRCTLVVNRNEQLLRLVKLNAPDSIVSTQRRLINEAIGKLTDWLPIDAAPLDGTVFVALTKKGVCRCAWMLTDWEDDGLGPIGTWWVNPDDPFWFEMAEDAPTHFVPMPNKGLDPSE